jgi:dephospho-CoA kinase
MKIIFILGKIGSGKTIFSNKLKNNNFLYLRKPLIFIEIDKFVKEIYENKLYEKKLILLSKKYGIKWSNTKRYKLLFNSIEVIKNKAWKIIEIFFNPIITNYIKTKILKNNKKKGNMIFDLALPNLIPKKIDNFCLNKKYILTNKQKYPSIYLLRKYRNFSYRKSLFLINLQNNIYKQVKKF